MADPQASAIGIQVKTQAPIGIFSSKPDRVYFVKLDNEGDIKQNQVIPSNYAKEGRIYLLNAEPGTYVAVATFRTQAGSPAGPAQPGVSFSLAIGRTGYTTYFSQELIKTTKIVVGSGEVVLMGTYVVKQASGLTDAEPIQNHYGELIAPGAIKSSLGSAFTGDYHYRGTLGDAKRDSDVRTEFIKKAREDLKEGGWESIFK